MKHKVMRVKNMWLVTCNVCGKYFPIDDLSHGRCIDCLYAGMDEFDMPKDIFFCGDEFNW